MDVITYPFSNMGPRCYGGIETADYKDACKWRFSFAIMINNDPSCFRFWLVPGENGFDGSGY